MKAIGEYVLLKQVSEKKKTQLITQGLIDAKDTHIMTNEVLQIGSKVIDPEIEIGDNPIFGEHMSFGNIKVISSTDTKMEAYVIVHYNDIIGIEDKIEKVKKK